MKTKVRKEKNCEYSWWTIWNLFVDDTKPTQAPSVNEYQKHGYKYRAKWNLHQYASSLISNRLKIEMFQSIKCPFKHRKCMTELKFWMCVFILWSSVVTLYRIKNISIQLNCRSWAKFSYSEFINYD